MAIRKVARLGHPVLREVGRKIQPDEIESVSFRALLQDMVDTMHEYGGIGLAAPQIHESLQVAIIEIESSNPRYPDQEARELTFFINPVIEVLDPTPQSFWEGCLSVPGLRGLVSRPRKISVKYLDENGDPQSLVAEDFLATVVQHELDHLNGVLYVDRLVTSPGKTQLAFTEEYQKYLLPEAEDQLEA